MLFSLNICILVFCLSIAVTAVQIDHGISAKPRESDFGDEVQMRSNNTRSNFISRRVQTRWADIFYEIGAKSHDHANMLDFGYGSPDYMPPQHLLDAMVNVSMDQSHIDSYKIHQYESMNGNERFLKVLGRFYSMLMKRAIDPLNEIIVTTGAAHALSLICNAYINPGDEIILFEPFYPNYYQCIRQSGGHPTFMPLKLNPDQRTNSSWDLTFDKDELRSKFNNKTKMIIINNPNNPTGKTFSKEDMIFIGHLAEKHNVLILADEVAQWYYFNDNQHNRLASLENFWNRTITVSSGGKTFSNTGWRIGWVIAPKDLIWGLSAMTESTVLSVSTPMQIAFALGLETELLRWNTTQSYFHHMRSVHLKARDKLIRVLDAFGAEIIKPNAGYFIVANITKIAKLINLSNETDQRPGMKLSNALRKQFGINTMPLTVFYSLPNAVKHENFLRFTFIKSPIKVDALEVRLKQHFPSLYNISKIK